MAIDYSKMSVYGDTYGNTQEDLDATQQDQETGIAEILLPNINTPYLNQDGGQNQIFSQEEYEKALANQNAKTEFGYTKPQSNNFLTRAFSNVMDNRYVQGARNLGSMITDPLMGGIGYLAKKVDKFSSLPYVDQQFIKENMAYKNPDSGLPQDLFGINTRSMFGNYAEYVGKRSKELNDSLEESKKDWVEKFGSLNAIDPRYNKTWAQMNKMNLSGQKYYGDKYSDFSKKKQAFDKSIELKEADRKIRKAAAQQEIIRKAAAEGIAQGKAYDYEGRDTPYGIHTSTISAPQAQTNRESQRGNGGNQGNNQGQGGPGTSGWGHAKGGRIRYGTGGIVTL